MRRVAAIVILALLVSVPVLAAPPTPNQNNPDPYRANRPEGAPYQFGWPKDEPEVTQVAPTPGYAPSTQETSSASPTMFLLPETGALVNIAAVTLLAALAILVRRNAAKALE